jgi:hypothetical protein
MNVHDVLAEYLTEHGFDGLRNADGGCACELADLFPCYCNDGMMDCQPSYKHECNTCQSQDTCAVDDSPMPDGWCMRSTKETP